MSLKKIKKIVEKIENNPVLLFRGSDFDDEFGVGNYFSTNYDFAKLYSKKGNVKKYKVDLGRTFDITNPEHFRMLKDTVGEITDPYAYGEEDDEYLSQFIDIQDPSIIANSGNSWEITEQFLDTIPNLGIEGFDSAKILEDGIVNYIIFNVKENVARIENEDYFTSIEHPPMDVYKNSNYFEIMKLLKMAEPDSEGRRELRALIPASPESTDDYYVWLATKAVHPFIEKILKLRDYTRIIIYKEEDNLSAIFLDEEDDSNEDEFRESFFIHNTKIKNMEYGDEDWEEEVVDEDYVATATWYNPQSLVNRKLEVDVYKNSSYPEIARLIKESKRGNLRFSMNSSEDYILWDADKMIHSSAIKHAKLGNEFDIKLDLLGIVFSTSNTGYKEVKEPCVYIYYGSANEFYNINAPMLTPWGSGTEENTKYVKEQFLKTHMYQSLKRAGINEVVVGSWL